MSSALNAIVDRCPLDPVPGNDERLVAGMTRLAAIIEDEMLIEIDPRTGAVLQSEPLPTIKDENHGVRGCEQRGCS